MLWTDDHSPSLQCTSEEHATLPSGERTEEVSVACIH